MPLAWYFGLVLKLDMVSGAVLPIVFTKSRPQCKFWNVLFPGWKDN
jgi:hypothetical protein